MTEGVDPRAAIEVAMKAFRPLPRLERYGHVSLWTMYYLGALIVPAIAAGVRTGRAPVTTIDALTCHLDDQGHVAAFLPRRGVARPSGCGFDEIVAGHLEIMIEDCVRIAGFPARVAWSNAAVTIDHAVNEARQADRFHGDALAAAEALITGGRHPLLARPYRPGGRRERRVCCLRYLIPGGALCPDICPRAATGFGRP